MWICPQCQREFKTKNQWHSCVKISPNDLLLSKPKQVRELYDRLVTQCSQFCQFKIDTTKSCIYFVSNHRFLVIKPQKSGIILEFLLDRKEDVFPVIKTFDIGKGRIVHYVKLDKPEDINDQIIGWINDAYQLLEEK